MPLEWPFQAVNVVCAGTSAVIWALAIRATHRSEAPGSAALRLVPAAFGATAVTYLCGYLVRSSLAFGAVLVIVTDPLPDTCTNIDGCYANERNAVAIAVLFLVPTMVVLASATAVAIAGPRWLSTGAGLLVVAFSALVLVAPYEVGWVMAWPGPPDRFDHSGASFGRRTDLEAILTLDAGRPVIRWR